MIQQTLRGRRIQPLAPWSVFVQLCKWYGQLKQIGLTEIPLRENFWLSDADPNPNMPLRLAIDPHFKRKKSRGFR
jgi:hypothetical protein